MGKDIRNKLRETDKDKDCLNASKTSGVFMQQLQQNM